MADSDKPARAPPEEALKLIETLRKYQYRRLGWSHWLEFDHSESDAAMLLDDLAAHRLSTALLNPSEEVLQAAWQAFFNSDGSGRELMRATLRGAAEVAAEHPISTVIAPSALLNPSEGVVEAGAKAMLRDLGSERDLDLADPYRRVITMQLSSADLVGMTRAALRAAAMKITGRQD